MTFTAQAIPARLAWSPDPAWAACNGSHDGRGTVRQPEASRKRARKGRANKAARKTQPVDGRAVGSRTVPSSHSTEALGHPLAGDVWWQQRPLSRESDEPFSECDCSDLEQYYDSDDDWVDSEVEDDSDSHHNRSNELQATALRRHQPRSIMDQSLSDLQDAPPVFPTPRRPDAVDLERHRSLTESIESLIHKSEQKDLINAAAKEVFDRFNHGEDGRISQLEFCTLVQVSGRATVAVPSFALLSLTYRVLRAQNFGVGMTLSAPQLWALCAPTLGPATGPGRPGWGSCRLSLREFQSFYRKWLSTSELRAKLTRKLRRDSVCTSGNASTDAISAAAADRRCRLETIRPSTANSPAVDGDDANIDTDDGLEASIDEMIELPEQNMGIQSMGHGVHVPFHLAIAMHPSTTAAVAMATQSSRPSVTNDGNGSGAAACLRQASPAHVTAEESLVVELLRSCERLEREKAEISRRLDEMLVDHDSMERRVFEVELEKRGLTTLLEKEAKAKQRVEEALKTKENQWHGVGTESLSDAELDDLLVQVSNPLHCFKPCSAKLGRCETKLNCAGAS